MLKYDIHYRSSAFGEPQFTTPFLYIDKAYHGSKFRRNCKFVESRNKSYICTFNLPASSQRTENIYFCFQQIAVAYVWVWNHDKDYPCLRKGLKCIQKERHGCVSTHTHTHMYIWATRCHLEPLVHLVSNYLWHPIKFTCVCLRDSSLVVHLASLNQTSNLRFKRGKVQFSNWTSSYGLPRRWAGQGKILPRCSSQQKPLDLTSINAHI